MEHNLKGVALSLLSDQDTIRPGEHWQKKDSCGQDDDSWAWSYVIVKSTVELKVFVQVPVNKFSIWSKHNSNDCNETTLKLLPRDVSSIAFSNDSLHD